MSMHAMRAMHSMTRQDSSVLQRQLPPGTWRRVFRFARRVTVLAGGGVVAEGTPDEIRRDPTVRDIYLGTRP